MMMGTPKPTKMQKQYAELDAKFEQQQQEVEMLKSALNDARQMGEENRHMSQLFGTLVEKNLIDQNGNVLGARDQNQGHNEAPRDVTYESNVRQ